METWFMIIVTLCVAAILKSLLSLISQSNSKCPPGPLDVPIISDIHGLRRSLAEFEATLRSLRSKFGPIITLRRGARPKIFICSRSLAHEALVQKGAIFADRLKPLPTFKITSSNQHNILSAGYGPTWRILRRNLTSSILHPSRVVQYSHARKWVLDILINNLKKAGGSNDGIVKVKDHFRFAMFCLSVLMCFGDKLNESQIRKIEAVECQLLVSFARFQVLNFWPKVTRILFRSRWNELINLRKKQEEVLIPLIKLRKATIGKDATITSYVDTLLTLEIQDEEDITKRKLTEGELVSVCSEFLAGGTDTTSTALQWIMANLVKYPDIQAKILDEIKAVVDPKSEVVNEEDLSKMPYLKAVVLEGLRRHPPARFLMPHAVTEEVELGGYIIPKNAEINFTAAEMGWDPKVWENPMEYKPERFLPKDGEDTRELLDVTGSREIKMMPFGAGRRICPGFGLAIFHLEYFVANLVWKFEWEAVDEVDLSEKQEFTTVMKYPLNARISPRLNVANM